MDDATKALGLLQLELPDKEQELSLQRLSPNTFTCFSKLPLEVRRMIWTQSLPGRRFIGLDSFLNATESGICCFVPSKCQRDPRPPTALHINQESRRVALEHYTFMYNTWWFLCYDPDHRWVRRYLFLDPKVDLVYMSAKCIIQQHPRLYNLAFHHFARNSEFFRSIKSLEIRDFDWYLNKEWYNEWALREDLGGFLNLFHGLKELHVVDFRKGSDFGIRLRDDPQNVEESLEILETWFYENAGYQPPEALRSVPEIILHDYRRIETRSDEGNREVGKIPYPLDNEKGT